jgi:hypothetical protein
MFAASPTARRGLLRGVHPAPRQPTLRPATIQRNVESTRTEVRHEWPKGKYLIVDEKGQGYLPIRDHDDGPENACLIECAHAALTSAQGSRTEPYHGPRKSEAIAKLKAACHAEGIPWPNRTVSCHFCQQPACTYCAAHSHRDFSATICSTPQRLYAKGPQVVTPPSDRG